jgi:thiol-disulfide isomerase/thioredoxin
MEANQPLTPTETDNIAPTASSRRFFVAIWVVIIALLALIAWGLFNNSQERPIVGATAPDFEIRFFDGYAWASPSADPHLQDMLGRPVVLNFWASWCTECHIEAELLEQLSREYGDEVLFLGIAYVDTPTKAMEYLRYYDITYPNAPDLQGRISSTYDITGVPETFIIAPDGTIADVIIGPINEQRVRQMLEQLLAESS